MSDPFHPSQSFDSIPDLEGVIETAYADRARHFFRERPEVAARVAGVRLVGERPGQVAFLKALPVARIETARTVTVEEEAAADNVVRSRRGDDDPGATRGPAPKQIERTRR